MPPPIWAAAWCIGRRGTPCRRSPISTRRWNSSPTTPRPITTAAFSTRRSASTSTRSTISPRRSRCRRSRPRRAWRAPRAISPPTTARRPPTTSTRRYRSSPRTCRPGPRAASPTSGWATRRRRPPPTPRRSPSTRTTSRRAKALPGSAAGPGRPISRSEWYRSGVIDAVRPQQVLEPLARVKHARAHGRLGNPKDVGDLLHRPFVVIDEVDHLALRQRQLRHAFAQERARVILLDHARRIVARVLDRFRGFVIEIVGGSAAQVRQRLVVRNRQDPCGQLRAPLETAGVAPDVEEHVARQVFCRAVANQPRNEAVDAQVVAGEQDVHGALVAARDAADQDVVGGGGRNGASRRRGAARHCVIALHESPPTGDPGSFFRCRRNSRGAFLLFFVRGQNGFFPPPIVSRRRADDTDDTDRPFLSPKRNQRAADPVSRNGRTASNPPWSS